MIDGPLGGAAFNNEFGRPALCGYFRTFELEVAGPTGARCAATTSRSCSPAASATSAPRTSRRREFPAGAPLVVLGGPAMLIGLGGGAASSLASGASHEDLDFASVQRDNAEMQRRCQEVIDRCWALGDDNPILSIHDVGAGGLSNALPELVHDSGRGARFELRAHPQRRAGHVAARDLVQRGAGALRAGDRARAAARRSRRSARASAARSRCVGQRDRRRPAAWSTTRASATRPIDMPLGVLLGKPPRMTRDGDARRVDAARRSTRRRSTSREAVRRVLRLPTVADKTFLITIGDRTVGGLVARDQMVGPLAGAGRRRARHRRRLRRLRPARRWRSASARRSRCSTRRPRRAWRSPRRSPTSPAAPIARARATSSCRRTGWPPPATPARTRALYDAVRAVGVELCPALGIAIPVGKDSMSMRTGWEADGERPQRDRAAVADRDRVRAGAPTCAARSTPELPPDVGPTELLLVDLGRGKNRLGGSALAQVYGQLGDDAARSRRSRARWPASSPRSRSSSRDGALARVPRSLRRRPPRDAARDGVRRRRRPRPRPRRSLGADPLAALFAEELGAVRRRCARADVARVRATLRAPRPRRRRPRARRAARRRPRSRPAPAASRCSTSARTRPARRLVGDDARDAGAARRPDLRRRGAGRRASTPTIPASSAHLTFDLDDDVAAPLRRARRAPARRDPARAGRQRPDRDGGGVRPRRLRRRRRPHDRSARGRASISPTSAGSSPAAASRTATCSAPATAGPSRSCFNARARDAFAAFFARPDTFALGVCNGCQMLSRAQASSSRAPSAWPRFVRNRSEQFEARLAMVRDRARARRCCSRGMAGSRLPIAVAHGEGRAEFATDAGAPALEAARPGRRALRRPPRPRRPSATPRTRTARPAASPASPRPTAASRSSCRTPSACSAPSSSPGTRAGWREDGPWMRIFRNARVLGRLDRPRAATGWQRAVRARRVGGAVGVRRRRRWRVAPRSARARRRAAGALVGGEPERVDSAQALVDPFGDPLAPLVGAPSFTGRHLRSGSHE